MFDNKNFILAIVLSIAVLVGWQYFIAGPQIQKAQKQAQVEADLKTASEAEKTPGATTATGTAPTGATAAAPGAIAAAPILTRDQALAASPRVPIATARVSGSINLHGARLDDLRLNDYRETVDPKSPTVILFSPSNGPDGYFAEFGWIASAGPAGLPGPDTVWTAPAGATLATATPVTLTYDNGAGLKFTRTIAIDDDFMFKVTDGVTNTGTTPVTLTPYGRIDRLGEPKTSGYFILHEGLIGVFGNDGLSEVKYKDLHDTPEKIFAKSDGGWLGITDKYWAATLVPEQGTDFAGRFSRLEQPTVGYQADFTRDPVSIAAGTSAEVTNRLFAGAKQVSVVDGYEKSLGIKKFELLIDWGWFHFITKPMFYLIDWFYRLLGNFGLAILAVTVTVKAAFFPLANKSYKSMSAMKKMQPQMAALREQYKDDKVKQQQELMALYKKEKINPLAGCWPVAIQIPVFFSLYKVLFITIEMRHAPFFGWIHDLSAPDPTHVFNLFGLLPFDPSTLPVLGGFLAIGVWPLIMGITMFVQMRLNPTPPDPTQAMIFTWMPLIFTFMLASFPAGLVIYWAWNNTLSVLQQYVIMRRQGVEVNLLGNIKETFRKKKPAEPVPAGAAAALPKAANDSDALLPAPRSKSSKNKAQKPKPRNADA